jgi:glycosyltransferase involved in cell wall biosynthesis
MCDHDLYLSASLWDGTSIAMLETMACGIFPIVSRIPSNLSWLADNKTTLMFDCRRADQLADRIVYACSNPTLVREGITANREIVVQRADREKNMRLLEQRYEAIIEREKKNG